MRCIKTKKSKRRFRISAENVHAFAQHIEHSSIAFMSLGSSNGNEFAMLAGSGTLVTIGNRFGILTAAHVLESLPDKGEIGIAVFNDASRPFGKRKIEMAYTTKILIKGKAYTENGPDLGFLDIPKELIGNLRATNSFINLNKERALVLKRNRPAKGVVCVVMGAVAEFASEEVDLQKRQKLITVKGLFLDGQASKKESLQNLIEFKLARHADMPKPNSYRGVSGGGFWCAYYNAKKKSSPQFVKLRLLGVAFYELAQGKKIKIICHGPRGIYGKLINAVERHFNFVAERKAA